MIIFRKYLLPGLIFQSVVIGGGYATGRELIEFFFPAGSIGGVLGLLVAGLLFGVVMAAAFEFARIYRAYDYRSFCRGLLGRGWVVFEVAYFVYLILVLAVVGAASGELVADVYGWPAISGTILLAVAIGFLTFMGSETIGRALSAWSLLLYSVYIALFIVTFATFGRELNETYAAAPVGDGWLAGGVQYTGYNVAALPAVLFAVVHLTTRREAVSSGFIAGAIAVIPAIFFYVAMMAQHPEIGDAPVPAAFLMNALNIPWLALIFQVVVLGTFVETGAGMLHSVNERIAGSYKERGREMPRFLRPIVAVFLLSLAVFLAAAVGIVDLIAKGYGALTFVFIAVLIVPLLSVGLWRIARAGKHAGDITILDGRVRGEER